MLAHGTGAINVDGCRVEASIAEMQGRSGKPTANNVYGEGIGANQDGIWVPSSQGRFPANLLHDGSEDVLAGFPYSKSEGGDGYKNSMFCGGKSTGGHGLGDEGSAARFFYSAKAGPLDRLGTAHATVKPVDLMRWLCRLVTPPNGHILEPFAGSGTTGIAAMAEGFDCTMIELLADHAADIERKLAFLRGEGGASVIERHRARIDRAAAKVADDGPLFGSAA